MIDLKIDCAEFYGQVEAMAREVIREYERTKKTVLIEVDEARDKYPDWYASIGLLVDDYGAALRVREGLAMAFDKDRMGRVRSLLEYAVHRRDICRERDRAQELQNRYNLFQNRCVKWSLVVTAVSLSVSVGMTAVELFQKC